MIHTPPLTFKRVALTVTALSLAVAACGGETASEPQPSTQATSTTSASTTTITAAPSTTVTPTTIPTPPRTTTTTIPPLEYQPTLIAYRYTPDQDLEYAISMEQEAEVTLEGGPEEEMPPGPIVTATTLAGTIN